MGKEKNLLVPKLRHSLLVDPSGIRFRPVVNEVMATCFDCDQPLWGRVVLLVNDPSKWGNVIYDYKKYVKRVDSVGSRNAGTTAMELSTLVEQRGFGREQGPGYLVFIESLKEMYRQDYDATLSFEYLLRIGPQQNVCVIAAVKNNNEMEEWLAGFYTINSYMELFEEEKKKPKRFLFF